MQSGKGDHGDNKQALVGSEVNIGEVAGTMREQVERVRDREMKQRKLLEQRQYEADSGTKDTLVIS